MRELSDAQVVQGIEESLGQERSAQAEFIRYLGEVDKRELYLKEGYGSLYRFCMKRLKLSRSSTLKRIQVARLSRRFPEVLGLVGEGRVHFSALSLLAPHLTEANCARLFAMAEGQSELKVAELLAKEFPKALPENLRDKLEWFSEDSAVLMLKITPEFVAKLEEAKAALKHQYPDENAVHVLESALDLLLDKKSPKRIFERSVTRQPIRKTSPTHSRVIPQRIKREVWLRDQGRCAYVSPQGHRCEETSGLEFDHRHAFAHGGRSDDARNIRLACFGHNRYLARQAFGNAYIERKIKEASG
jgi:5-methylcytosine-specific restriction endonuclease McrA